jgi:hypothetical protein
MKMYDNLKDETELCPILNKNVTVNYSKEYGKAFCIESFNAGAKAAREGYVKLSDVERILGEKTFSDWSNSGEIYICPSAVEEIKQLRSE